MPNTGLALLNTVTEPAIAGERWSRCRPDRPPEQPRM